MKEIHNTSFWPVIVKMFSKLLAKFFILLSLVTIGISLVSLGVRVLKEFMSINIPTDDLSGVFIFGVIAWVICLVTALALDEDSGEILPF